jgi:hypothetical protein
VKKYNYILSLFLIPAIVLQAGNSTCTASGGSAPTLTLPATVTGVHTFSYSSATLYNFVVDSVSSAGAFTVGTTYSAWCTNAGGLVPGGGVSSIGKRTPPEDPNNPSGIATYTPINSYSISGAGGESLGTPGYTWDATKSAFTQTYLSLTQEWSAVNWILNNPMGVTPGLAPTTTDTQAAIWQLLHSPEGPFVTATQMVAGSALTPNSWLLYKDALANGLTFYPSSGQVVAVLMNPTTPPTSPKTYQGFFVPLPIGCPYTGSATLTKSVNVGAAGANAFQLVTYTYTINNIGPTPLSNLVVVDDNGTPNYSEDDYTLPIPVGTTIAPGASYSISTSVYLPISLFYQSGGRAAFDTLIPQVVPVAAGSPAGTLPSLLLTYLIDTDVTDNTYGTGSSAGWAGNGGHTFAEIEAGYAEFALYNSKGAAVSDFDVNYLKNEGVSTSLPSGYGSTIGQVFQGGTSNISYLVSTLADNLNDYPQFYTDTTNSPLVGTPNWEVTAGYKVLVNEGIFGVFNSSFSAAVKKNYLAATETGFSGKCGSPQSISYTPGIYGDIVNSTAYLCAQACGCSTVVHAKACLSVKLCGPTKPSGCTNYPTHICQNPVHCGCSCAQCQAGNHGKCTNTGWFGIPAKCTPPVCSCTCAQCKAGNHGSCTTVGCTDPTCHANNCNHNTVKCVVAAKPVTYTW